MSEYYNVVPWRNCKEWNNVYENLFSSTSSNLTKEEALKWLLIWKARSPFLPAGIESTLTLLLVHIQDIKNVDEQNDQMIRLAYSTALMRFVNHMLDSQTIRGSSLYKAAKKLGVPDWIIDLRHDTAHGNSMPSVELLREATIIGFDWLKTNYWDKHKIIINDYVTEKKTLESNEKITTLMNMYISLSICSHSKLNIKCLADISDRYMTESIVNDIHDLFCEVHDLSNLKKKSILSVINILNVHSKDLLKSKNSVKDVNRALLGEDSLFLSMELLNFFNNAYSKKPKPLSKHYIHCFEVLLTFLHTNDLLQDFILELIKVTQCCDENIKKRWLAAVWVSEILKALKKSSQFGNKMKMQSAQFDKNKKELKALFFHWFPNEKGCSLLLDLFKPIPEDLTNINFVQPIISTYNEYLTYFIEDMLNLIEPQLPLVVVKKICELAKLLASRNRFPSNFVTSKIFTVDDVKAATEESHVIDIDMDSKKENVEDISRHVNLEQQIFGLWQLASPDYDWSTCPIGAVPWDSEHRIEETEANSLTEPMDIEVI